MSELRSPRERRASTRRKSLLRGCIYFNNRRSSLDCLIRDISATGARLIFSDAVSIPDVVDLFIPQKEQMLRAQVQWRRGEEAGVGFAEASHAPAPKELAETAGLAERVRKLEAEVAAMRKVLKRLKADLSGDDEAA